MAIPINELFWLEQEDLDSPDNMFMPADTPPNCLNAYKHRRRICKEEYDRVLTRAIIKQSKEMASLVTKYARSVDTALLPERQPPSSHHQFITGQQYVRQNTALFSKAMAHVMTNSDKVEDGTPKFDDMDVVKDNEALMYKTECQVK
ncbi:hypothetical protein BC941DRAFT_416717 [Chlamydoabsidia padenii]|nr:hypothetical protein BC941DRAFT_416717 [Chlamydoabsidia padenii]